MKRRPALVRYTSRFASPVWVTAERADALRKADRMTDRVLDNKALDDLLARRLIERSATRTCPECGRVFEMSNAADAAEWVYGHDCE